jgi:hypothetical protein
MLLSGGAIQIGLTWLTNRAGSSELDRDSTDMKILTFLLRLNCNPLIVTFCNCSFSPVEIDIMH